MISIFLLNRSISSGQISILWSSIIRHFSLSSSSSDKILKDDTKYLDCLVITKKMRLLGLRSNQALKALKIYDDYVYRQKKLPDLRMFTVAINCAMIAEDLSKGREIHQFIEDHCPHLKENLMLKQQLRYFYIKCNDRLSAEKLFQESTTMEHKKTEEQQNQELKSLHSTQSNKMKTR